LTIRGKAFVAGAYEHPLRAIPNRSTPQVHADVALGAVAGVIALATAWLRYQPLYGTDKALPLPSGITLSGARYAGSDSAASCFLIRVSAQGCPYCKVDSGPVARVISEARARRCDIVWISRELSQADLEAPAGVIRLQFVDLAFGSALHTESVPATLLLDRGGRPLFYRIRTLSAADAARFSDLLRHVKVTQ